MERNDFIAKQCRVCGKQFEVLHPSRWAYKKGNNCSGYKWYCSWSCLRKEEKEKEKMKTVMPAGELHKRAMEICIEGGDPVAYLKDNGSEDAVKLWWWIRNKYRKTGKDLYEQLPEEQKIGGGNRGARAKKPAAEKKPEEKPAEEKRQQVKVKDVKTGDVTYEEMIIKPEGIKIVQRLKITALESKEIENAEWQRCEGGIELVKGGKSPLSPGFRLALSAEGWGKLCDEIHIMLEQFGEREA